MVKRLILVIAACSVLHLMTVSPVQAQQQEDSGETSTHHHPAGMTIIMKGSIVEPISHFAADSTTQDAPALDVRTNQGSQIGLHPVMLGFDEKLYLLYPADKRTKQKISSSVGESASVTGTVFPAGSGYIIVVDSLKRRSDVDRQ